MTPWARNAPKLWPAEPWNLKWIVPSGRQILAVSLGDLVAEDRADRAIGVDDLELGADGRAVFQRRPGQVEQLGAVERQLEAVVLAAGAIGAHVRPRFLDRFEQTRQIEPVRFPVLDRVVGFEAIDAADHLVDRAEAELGHELAGVLGDHEQIIDDVLRLRR